MLPLLLTDISRAGMPLNPWTRVLLNLRAPCGGLFKATCLTATMNNSASCTILFVSFMPNNPAIHPLFPSLRSWRGKWLSISRIQSSTPSLLDLSVLKMNLAACHGFPDIWELVRAAVSEALGVGPCVPWSLPWKLDDWWADGVGSMPTGSWAYRNSQVL